MLKHSRVRGSPQRLWRKRKGRLNSSSPETRLQRRENKRRKFYGSIDREKGKGKLSLCLGIKATGGEESLGKKKGNANSDLVLKWLG